ncbi:MAG: hypothetical protein K5644_01400 [Lachnospiraceae bacterium]|nr:hypothetical protein [Lachnospiraceae bacterium]
MTISKADRTRKIIIYIAIGLLTALSVFCFNDKDCLDISRWGKCFIDSLLDGEIRSYTIICNDLDLPNNYSAFSNIVCGIWILPVYIIDRLFAGGIQIAIYCTWVKLGVVVLNVLVAKLIHMILSLRGAKINIEYIFLIWFSFNLVQMKSIGNGQIDIIGILLMLLSLYFFFKKDYTKFALIGGAAICFKIFPIILVAVLLAYLPAEKGVKCIRYVILTAILPIVQKTIENVFFIDYNICERVGFEYSHANFMERIFGVQINALITPVIVISIVIVLLVYILRKNNFIDESDLLYLTCIIFFMFFLLVWSHCQWYLYALPLLLIAGLMYGITSEYMIMAIGFNISQMIYNSVTTLYMKRSLLGMFTDCNEEFDYNILFADIDHIGAYMGSAFFAFFLSMIIFSIVKRVQFKKDISPIRAQNIQTNSILMWVLFATTFISETVFLIKYL